MVAPKKPADRRQRKTTNDVGLVALPSARADVPPPPGGIGPTTADAWEAFWTSELAALVQPADMPALTRLFKMYHQRDRLEAAWMKSPFVEGGATGRALVSHPAAAQVSSLDSRIVALEDRFGLTPLARLRLGITFGAAARSLDQLNAQVFADDDDEEDPRLRAIEGTAREA